MKLHVLTSILCICFWIYVAPEAFGVTKHVATTQNSQPRRLAWYRWTTGQFEILSVNDTQAQYLYANVENIKKWTYTRWNLKNYKMALPCRLVCVDEPRLFKRLFNLDRSRVEMRYDDDGKPSSIVAYLLLDPSAGTPSQSLPAIMTRVCLLNIDARFGVQTPPFVSFGMSGLNQTVSQIREFRARGAQQIKEKKNQFSVDEILGSTQEEYSEFSSEERLEFQLNSVLFADFVVSEFGVNTYKNLYIATAKSDSDTLNTGLRALNRSSLQLQREFVRHLYSLVASS